MRFSFSILGLRRSAAAAAVAAGLLVACGGGTQIDPFRPDRLLSFGDELSALTDSGYKYSTNLYTEEDGLVCDGQPLWVQYLAKHYSDMAYPQCNPSDVANPPARTVAAYGATVADFVAQADSFAATDGFNGRDMVTVLVGMHDVLAAYARYPAESESTLRAELADAGERLATRINALTDTGARVLVSTVPDLGLTPYAIAQKAAHTDTDRAELLTRMVDSFNRAMRLKLVNDGSKIGLLLADDMSRAMVRSPSNYSLTNVKVPVCAVALPDCTTQTLIDGGNASDYLWADELHPAATLQLQLGVQAVSRVENNPF